MPTTEYIRRVIVFVEASDQAAANVQAALLDPDIGGNQTLSIPLSATGSAPATWYSCGATCRLVTYNAVLSLQATFPTAKIYRGYNEYDEGPETKYTLQDALTDAGLQLVDSGV